MSRFAELPDGRRLEFPDETTDEVIQATVRRELGLTPAPTAQPTIPAPTQRERTIEGPRGVAAEEALLAIGSAALAEPVSGLAGLLGGVAGLAGRLVAGPVPGPLPPGAEKPLERAARFQAGTAEALTFQPRTEAGAAVVGAVGRAAELGVKGVRVPIAGLSGLVQLASGAGAEGAAETVRRTVVEGIGPTAGAALERAGAPPIISTIAETLPIAAATVAGARPLPRRVPRRPGPAPVVISRAEPTPRVATPTEPTPTVARPTEPAPTVIRRAEPIVARRSPEQIVADLKKGKTEAVAAEIVPDVKVVEAAQRLGIDLNVEHYATSTAFQDVARALKSRPGSELLAGEVKALRDLATRADELVTDIGGSIDKAAVSDDILNSTRSTIDKLQKEADVAYAKVRDAIPNQTRVQTDSLREFIQNKIDDFGGDDSLLSRAEQRVKKVIDRAEEGSITYAALDRIRRDVGDGFNKRSGPFANDSELILRELYDALSDTQQGAADAFGIGELYTEAKGLISRRKGIEDQAIVLFGRNAAGSLVPKIRAAATGLPKGDVTAFNKLIQALPEARRGEVAATVLGELFAAGSRQGGQLGTGFAVTWRNLNRNTRARNTLLKSLPKEARKRFDDIGRVMNAIVRSNAKSLANPSGSAGPIIAALEQGSIATRLYGAGQAVAGEAVVGIAGGIPGLATVLRMTRGKRPDVSQVAKADELLTSQTFKDAIKAAVEGDTFRANTIIEGSPKFKQWEATLTESDSARLARVGFIGFVSGQLNEEG